MAIKRNVYLVAGHGGGDPGSSARGRTEAAEAIDICSRTATLLIRDGQINVRVVPHDLDMYGGINWINQQPGGIDDAVAISFHKNSFAGSATGYETWGGETAEAQGIAKAIHVPTHKWSGLKDRGVKNHLDRYPEGLGFIRDTKFWSVLLELGFMQTDHFENAKYAQGAFEGILNIWGLKPKVVKPSPKPQPAPQKLYKVISNEGTQLGAYSVQKNAYVKYVEILKNGKIISSDGSDVTDVLEKAYGKPLPDTPEDYDHLEAEINENRTRLDKVEKEQGAIVSLLTSIGKLFAAFLGRK